MCHRKTKILLTGYRATGKSLIGEEVARRLGFAFLDTDREIEKRAGKTITSMVAEKGWPYFRALEKELLDDLADREKMVVASGGGAVMNHNSWQRLRRSAFTIWLSASAETICSRLAADSKSGDQRPSLTDKDILEEVESVLHQRRTMYEEGSDLQISSEQDAGAVADKIIEAWECRMSDNKF